jgi:putative ABC transport system permease protein
MRWKHVLRHLAAMPLFTGMAVLTLALGIGANTAIFSVISGVLLKPLPYPRSGELVALDHAAPGLDIQRAGAAPFLYFTYREDGRVFQDVAMWNTGTVSVTGIARPEEVRALFTTDGLLPILGAQPMLGRVFSRADDAPGGAETVVLTAGYWRAKFGGDPSVVGRTVTLDGQSREIIGVLPDTFRFLDRDVSLIVPMRIDRSKVFIGNFSYSALARLKPGQTIEQATADATRLIPIALRRFPPFPGATLAMFEKARITPQIRSMKDDLVGDVQNALWVLMGTIAIVLLIACANVANLLLVRAESRQQELAVRAALGADSRRIVGELLMESMTLAVAGGVVGLGLAFAAVRLLVTLEPGNLPRLQDITVDLPVLIFAVALTLLSGLLFGVIPALKQAGAQLATTLRAGGRTASASKDRERARNVLVVAQVALALVLLVSSGLMIRTFRALVDVDPGFVRPGEVQTLRLSISDSQVKDEAAVVRMHQAILDRLAAVPGVSSVALASTTTMSGQAWHDPLFAEDRPYAESEVPPIRMFKFVAPGYMKTIGGSIVAGRDFTWDDALARRPVAMVSANLARELWGGPTQAIGKRMRPYAKGIWREVVGVVSDTRDDGVTKKAATIAYWPISMTEFLPSEDSPVFVLRNASYLVRSSRTGSEGFVRDLERAVWSVNPNLPLAAVRTLEEIYDASLARTSFTLVMLAIAGTMALVLGVAGIYGVISYAVSQRRREIGIRIALGATSHAVTGLFVRHGMILAGVGVAIGLVTALAITRLMATLLFEVSPVDPLTYALVSLLLFAATVLACYLPALRASRVDPIGALRAE